LFQICQFIDEILDDVYSHADLSLDHQYAVPLPCDIMSRDGDTPVHSSVNARGTTGAQLSSQLISRDTSNLLSVNDGSQSERHVPSRSAAHNSACSDTVMTSPSQPLSQVHNLLDSLHNLPVCDLVSQLHIRLAPLSDFLTQHLALLQTWLSCASYGQLVALLCRHIAQVDCIGLRFHLNLYTYVSIETLISIFSVLKFVA